MSYTAPTFTNGGPPALDAALLQEMAEAVEAAQITAGENITINGNVISAKGGVCPQIIVTTTTGSTVTCTKGTTTLTATEVSGTWTFEVPEYGLWTLTATLGTDSKSAAVVVDTVKQYNITLKYTQIFGVEWDGTSTTAWSRTDAAADFPDPVAHVLGSENYGSPFDDIMPWSGMVIEERTVGTMVKIPKFWFKWSGGGGSPLKLQIANGPVAGFMVSPAHMDRGDGVGERDFVYVGRYFCGASACKSVTGQLPKVNITRATARTTIHNLGRTIWQYDLAMVTTIWMLYLVEYADWNSQLKIGYGCGNETTIEAVGASDNMPYHTGTMQSSRSVYGVGCQYRHIEGLWENASQFADGCYNSSEGFFVIKNPSLFSDTDNGTLIGAPIISGYPTVMTVAPVTGFEWVILPTTGGGGGWSYVPDYCSITASGLSVAVGGNRGRSEQKGLFQMNCITSTTATSGDIGCRLMELPHNA